MFEWHFLTFENLIFLKKAQNHCGILINILWVILNLLLLFDLKI